MPSAECHLLSAECRVLSIERHGSGCRSTEERDLHGFGRGRCADSGVSGPLYAVCGSQAPDSPNLSAQSTGSPPFLARQPCITSMLGSTPWQESYDVGACLLRMDQDVGFQSMQFGFSLRVLVTMQVGQAMARLWRVAHFVLSDFMDLSLEEASVARSGEGAYGQAGAQVSSHHLILFAFKLAALCSQACTRRICNNFFF